jgi:hypothetical protein
MLGDTGGAFSSRQLLQLTHHLANSAAASAAVAAASLEAPAGPADILSGCLCSCRWSQPVLLMQSSTADR